MPAYQQINDTPVARQRSYQTPLESTLSSFTEGYRQDRQQQRESDALSQIYKQYQQDDQNIDNAYWALQTNKEISPTRRVEATNQLINLKKTNAALQTQAAKQTKADQQVRDAADKKAKKEADEQEERKTNVALTRQVEIQNDLPEGSLAEVEQKPQLANNIVKKKNEPRARQSDLPIDPDQLRRMEEVRKMPGYEQASGPKKFQMLTKNGVSEKNATAEQDVYAQDELLKNKQLSTENKTISDAYKAQEKFIDQTTSAYRAYEADTKPKLLQMQKLASDSDLLEPNTVAFLENLGIPLGAVGNPDSELFHKLSLDLLKGLPETYGNRILKVEVDNFLRTIPALTNSPNGRRMIASNMLKLGEMKEVYYNEMRKKQRDYLDSNKPLPRDFQQIIFDQVKPQIDRINSEFVKLSEAKEIPVGTVPFFDRDGNVKYVPKEHADWAAGEGGGRRIW